MTERKAPTIDAQAMDGSAQPEQMASTFADRLMNDLFDGVERALEGDVEALEERRSVELDSGASPSAESAMTTEPCSARVEREFSMSSSLP